MATDAQMLRLKEMADMASNLDYFAKEFTGYEQQMLNAKAIELHDMVEVIAGPRSIEIYGTKEGLHDAD